MLEINAVIFASGTLTSAILKHFTKSYLIKKIFIYIINGCCLPQGKNIEIIDDKQIKNLKRFILNNNINLAIVFNEAFSQNGLVNFLKYNLNIPTVGITRYWAQLENSKKFAKEFMIKNNIPTPPFSVINDCYGLKKALEKFGIPCVIKINSLQQGFGAFVCYSDKECFDIAKKILKHNDFFIIEKYIQGEEITLHLIWDGNNLIALAPVRDYKKSKNNNEGINTGSLGSYMPVNLSEKKLHMTELYVKRLEKVFLQKKPNFTGIFACDLIFTENEVFNLEFNMRPCTPEFEVFIEHINNDLLELFLNIAKGNCKNIQFEYKNGITGCVSLVHKDYLKHLNHNTFKRVQLPDEFFSDNCNIIINKNLISLNNNFKAKVSTNSRFLSLINNDIINPFPLIYNYADKMKDRNIYFRTDIGE